MRLFLSFSEPMFNCKPQLSGLDLAQVNLAVLFKIGLIMNMHVTTFLSIYMELVAIYIFMDLF